MRMLFRVLMANSRVFVQDGALSLGPHIQQILRRLAPRHARQIRRHEVPTPLDLLATPPRAGRGVRAPERPAKTRDMPI